MKKRMIHLASLTLGGMLAILPAAHAAEEQTVAAPKKNPQSAASEASKDPKKEDAKKAAEKPAVPPESLKECATEVDVNTLEDLFRAIAVASILERGEGPAPGSSAGTPVVWRRAE